MITSGPTTFRVAAGAIAVTTSTALPVFLTGALAVQIAEDLHLDPAGLGLAVALYFAVSATVALPAGRIIDRIGSGVSSTAAVVGAAVFMLLIAGLAQSYRSLLVLLLASAWCNVVGQLSSNSSLARSMPADRLGLSFGAKQASVPTATLLAGVAVPAIALPLGWRWSFVIGAAVALCALAATPRGSRPARPPLPAARSATPLALAVIGAAASLAAAAANAMTIFLVASSVSRGIAPSTAGLVLTLGSVIALFMRMLHGWLADRRPTGHFAYVAGSLTLGAIGVALLALPGTVPLLVGVVLGMGLGWSWPGLLQFAIIRLNPSTPATATGAVQVGVYAGGCLGPLCFGFIAMHFGFATGWILVAGAMVIAACVLMIGRRMLRSGSPHKRDDRTTVASEHTSS